VLYADKITGSMKRAMDETTRRRARQIAHNEEHGITPQTVLRGVADMVGDSEAAGKIKDEANSYTPTGRKKRGRTGRTLEMAEDSAQFIGGNMQAVLAELETKMFKAAENLEFEEAARYRDEMNRLKSSDTGAKSI